MENLRQSSSCGGPRVRQALCWPRLSEPEHPASQGHCNPGSSSWAAETGSTTVTPTQTQSPTLKPTDPPEDMCRLSRATKRREESDRDWDIGTPHGRRAACSIHALTFEQQALILGGDCLVSVCPGRGALPVLPSYLCVQLPLVQSVAPGPEPSWCQCPGL